MIKSLLFIFLGVTLSFATLQSNAKVQTRTGDFPAEQMQAQKKEIVKLVAKEIKDTLPQVIDKFTTFTNIKADGTTLRYTFEINTGSKSDESVKNEDSARMKKAVTVGVCQSSRKFLEAGINTSYIYISTKTKVELFRFDISQKNCVGLVH